MKRRSLILGLLVISVAVNVTLAVLYFQSRNTPTPTSVTPTGKGPKVLIDSENFDFSGTGLSDDSAKLPAPDLTPPPAPDAPIQIEFK
jgi:hypothetical protein